MRGTKPQFKGYPRLTVCEHGGTRLLDNDDQNGEVIRNVLKRAFPELLVALPPDNRHKVECGQRLFADYMNLNKTFYSSTK